MLDDFGLASDPRLIPSFVHAAVAKGNIEIAWKRFQEMDSNDRPLPLYQGLIRLCAEKQQPRLLEELELALNRSNKVTDNSVLFELVKAHTDLCQLEVMLFFPQQMFFLTGSRKCLCIRPKRMHWSD